MSIYIGIEFLPYSMPLSTSIETFNDTSQNIAVNKVSPTQIERTYCLTESLSHNDDSNPAYRLNMTVILQNQ